MCLWCQLWRELGSLQGLLGQLFLSSVSRIFLCSISLGVMFRVFVLCWLMVCRFLSSGVIFGGSGLGSVLGYLFCGRCEVWVISLMRKLLFWCMVCGCMFLIVVRLVLFFGSRCVSGYRVCLCSMWLCGWLCRCVCFLCQVQSLWSIVSCCGCSC